jgi:predicted  nucleic acid-binding Zn-ribbon protein
MIRIVEALTTVQDTRLKNRTLTPEHEKEIARLCSDVPALVLQKFDRFVTRGKKGVAMVRNGVCNECHIRLPTGTLADLAYTTELHYCDNCGRVLYQPQGEPPGVATDVRKSSAPAPAVLKPAKTRKTRVRAQRI